MDRQSIVDEMERARDDFHRLVDTATTAELRQQSNGTKWTNDQLLFHMLFGYLIVRTLLILVRALARAPAAFPSSSQQSSTRPRRPFTLLTTWDPSAAREFSATPE